MKPEAKVEVMGKTYVAVSQAQNIQSTLQQIIVMDKIGRLGMEWGLDSSFTNIIGLSLGAIQGDLIQNPGSPLESSFQNILPNLSSSLANYGIEKLGLHLGLDPRISSLIGAPISAVIGGVGFDVGKSIGENIFKSVSDGVLRGVTSLGVEYLTQKADLNPLLGSLTSRAITGAIEGVLGGGNIFGGIFNAFKDSALNVTRLGVQGNNSWSQAQYLQRVINFSKIIQDQGFSKAIETYATGIFHQDSIESLVRTYGSIQKAIEIRIAQGKEKPMERDNQILKSLSLLSKSNAKL
jgi:hypothetical protein